MLRADAERAAEGASADVRLLRADLDEYRHLAAAAAAAAAAREASMSAGHSQVRGRAHALCFSARFNQSVVCGLCPEL